MKLLLLFIILIVIIIFICKCKGEKFDIPVAGRYQTITSSAWDWNTGPGYGEGYMRWGPCPGGGSQNTNDSGNTATFSTLRNKLRCRQSDCPEGYVLKSDINLDDMCIGTVENPDVCSVSECCDLIQEPEDIIGDVGDVGDVAGDIVGDVAGDADECNCPANFDPVCMNGSEYNNECKARCVSDTAEITPGLCPIAGDTP